MLWEGFSLTMHVSPPSHPNTETYLHPCLKPKQLKGTWACSSCAQILRCPVQKGHWVSEGQYTKKPVSIFTLDMIQEVQSHFHPENLHVQKALLGTSNQRH